MRAHLIDTHLLILRSRSSAKVKVKYQGNVSQKMGVSGALVFHKHILFTMFPLYQIQKSPFQQLYFRFISSTGHRPASFFHGPLSIMRLSVCPRVHPSARTLTFSLNISEATYRILMKFHRNVPGIVLFRIYGKNLNSSKTGCHCNKT